MIMMMLTTAMLMIVCMSMVMSMVLTTTAFMVAIDTEVHTGIIHCMENEMFQFF